MAGGGIEVELADGTLHRAPQVVLAADAWTNDLLASFDRRLPLTIIQAQVTYFAPPDPARFAPDRFPIWIWMDDPSFYGFPTYGEAGPKAAEDVGGDEVTPATRTFERNEVGFRRLTDFLERHLPEHVGPEIYTKTCLYTLTPDRDFVVDRLPDVPGVVVALGAAHAFKFASVLGRILSELVIDGATPSAGEIERVRDRPADPPRGEPRDELPRVTRDEPTASDAPRKPRRLREGDTVAVVAPASSWENRSELLRGVAGARGVGPDGQARRPRQRSPRLHGRSGRGSRGRLHAALADPEVRAIVCLQGGYGTPRLIPLFDESAVRRQPQGDLRLQRPDDPPSRPAALGQRDQLLLERGDRDRRAGGHGLLQGQPEAGALQRRAVRPDRPEPGRPVRPDDRRRAGRRAA